MKSLLAALLALVTAVGFDRVAHADETTTCSVDSWGDLKCITTSSDPVPSGKGSTVGGVAGATILAGVLAGLIANRSDNPDTAHNHEVGLGIMVGVEMFFNPLILYFDGAAPEPEVKTQWQHRASVIAEVWGSAVRVSDGRTAAAPGGRITVGKGRIGLEVAGEAATDPGRYSLVSAHFLLRAPPRSRTVIALAIGASRRSFGQQVRSGLDVSVPHTYILSRDDETGAADVLITSRPGFFYGDQGIDIHLDAALVVPVAGHVAVEIGGGVFTFDKQACVEGSAGLVLVR